MKNRVVQNVAVVALLSSSLLFANQGKVELVASSAQEKIVVNADGVEELTIVPIDKIVPGDVVIYSNSVLNNSSKSASNLVVTNPIPEHMEFVSGSLSCDEAVGCSKLFSIDGGLTFKNRDELLVTDGGVQRVARASEITTVQWILKRLSVGSRTEVTFKAKLK